LRLIDAALASEQLLQFILPGHLKGQRRVEWLVSNDAKEPIPSKEWIQKLWQWLGSQQSQASGKGAAAAAASGVMALADWPIIPTTSGFLLAPESLKTSILVNPPSSSTDSSLLSALNKLGCEIFDSSLTGSSSPENQLFAHPADGPGVLRALLNSYKKFKSSGTMDQWFESVLPAEREELRTFLLQPRWFGSSKQKRSRLVEELLIRFLTKMPIFPRAASLIIPQQEENEKQDAPASSSSIIFTDVQLQKQRYLIPHDLHAAFSSCEAVLRHPSLLKSGGREADGVLLDHLGVKQLTKAAFYKHYVLPALPQVPLLVAQPVSIQLLRELPMLHQADPTLIPLLKDTPLVTTVDGTAVTVASQLYDPRNGDLMLLLDPGKNFPAGEYGPVLDQLKMLGMRTNAGRDTVLQAARDISTQQHSTVELEAAASRGRALLAYIDMEASRLNKPSPANSSANGDDGVGFNLDSVFSKVASFLGGDGSSATSTAAKITPSTAGEAGVNSDKKNEREVEEFWEQLKSLAWCPVQCTPPVPGLPWRTTSTATASSSSLNGTSVCSPVAAPKEMRRRAETWLVCSQRLIIDGEPRSQVLLTKMGWNTPLDCEILARQLAALGTAFTPPIKDGEDTKMEDINSNEINRDRDTISTTTTAGSPSFSSSLRQQLAEIVPQFYRTLATLPPRDLTKVRTILGNTTPCIWIGDGFAPVGKVAMKGPLNLSSAGVYVIPLELAPFRDLLLALGIPASFSAEQYIGVLAAMHAELSSQKFKSLSSTQLEQALAIAAALADMHIPASATLYLPDEHAVLRATSELMYNDAPWTSHTGGNTIGSGDSSSPEENFHFIHPVISNDVAERLGVTSLQRCLLAHNADAFSMALTGAAVEAFGQSEALTTR